MAANNSTVDGMGFEEVNQASDTDIISGTNVYATTAVTTPTVSATTVNSTYVSGAGNAIYGQVIVAQNLYVDVAASGAAFHERNKGALHSVSIGSGTAVYGAVIQAGSGVLASNDAWITFPVAYTGLPTVITQNNSALDSELLLSLGSLNAGSFHMTGTNASDKFGWTSIGI